uniref:2-iminobutanoate/2-iminopropanoate deaminase n=1 Tax=Ornithorhynchus anatinus TaxID=9258 RepID=A0A6I8PAN8_ORNAN
MSSLIKKVISTAKAPGAIGPYSQAVLVDKTMYISGQIGMDPANGQLVPGGVVEEAKQALSNMGEILKAADCDFSNVVKTTVLLADINDFNAVNEIYKQSADLLERKRLLTRSPFVRFDPSPSSCIVCHPSRRGICRITILQLTGPHASRVRRLQL